MDILVKILVDQKDIVGKLCLLQIEWLIIYKTHLYALFVISGHDSDALMSDTDVGSNAIFYHTVISLNNLEENDMCHKLHELLETGIIEELPEGPTGWVSVLVVTPKSDGDIRICVDMRCANIAIVRVRQLIP